MKGQYFLPMVLVTMLLMTAIATYFASTNQINAYKTYSYKPYLLNKLVLAKEELVQAFVESVYNGTWSHLENVEQKLKYLAETRDENLTIECTHSSNENTFTLDCGELRLDSGDDYARTKFTYNYTVPFAIRTFRDKTHAYETDAFNDGETVYLWVTGNNTDTINVTIVRPSGSNFTNVQGKIVNWHWNTSFTPDMLGDWVIKVLDVNTSKSISKTVHYGTTNVLISTYVNGVQATSVSPGENLTVTVRLKDSGGDPVNCRVMMDAVYPNGKYLASHEGETTNGAISWTFNVPETCPTGNISVSATEQCTWYQNETNVTVS